MSETPKEVVEAPSIQADFGRITTMVSAEFQVEEALLEHNIPTYYLKQSQETKQAFLRLLKNLETMNLVAVLRRQNGRIVLRVISKPPVRKSNILVNWVLFFATIGTTFVTGYMISSKINEFLPRFIDPLVGGVTFTIALMAALGLHELGHKLLADKRGVDATPPYFIPGPPPMGGFLLFGTFGAVIVQKSLPPNKDSLFDIGSSGPILSFILATIATIIGLLFSPIKYSAELSPSLPIPLLFWLLAEVFVVVPPAPSGTPYAYIMLHPVAFAGWVGMFVTMLNLLPAAMLDGGHVSRSLFNEKTRTVLTYLSVLSLVFISLPMSIFVLFMSMSKHPGPLDDVSSLSTSRKIVAIVLGIILVLSSFLHYLVFAFLELFGL